LVPGWLGTVDAYLQHSRLQTCQLANVFLIYLFSFQTIPHSLALFCTFLHSPKTQPFSFQPIPHSFAKTPGVVVFLTDCFSGILSSLESASLKSRTKMELTVVKPAVQSIRCTYRTASGRQCRLAISDAQSGLCANHHAVLKQRERADVADMLFRDAQDFQTAQGINYSLRSLYWFVGKNRISSRRANVLAYISSLLLRTLPAIAAERKAGIRYRPFSSEPDPTKKPS